MERRKSIIFDLDGTLWDATGCAPAIWNRIFDKHDEVKFRMTQELAASLMGKTMEEIGDALFPNIPVEQRRKIVDEFGDEEVAYLKENGAVLFPGMTETIQKLFVDYDLYIVSNCQDGYVPAFLAAHKMEAFFKDIEMSGRTGMDKGKNISLIMERNGISKADAVYIGDTEGDEKATRFAGIPFVWAKYGFGKAASPDAVLNDIRELPSVLSSLLRNEECVQVDTGMKHAGTQKIETARLTLRRFLPEDGADMLKNWASDPNVQHEYGEPTYETPEAAEGLLQKYLAGYAQPDFYRWAVIERESGQNIGMIAFCKVWEDCETAEIEYCIGADFWGHGYAGEALAAVIDWTFAQTGFQRLEAYHRAANPKSGRVLEKSVMHRTETVERFIRAGETPDGEVCYAIERNSA